ncbi:MAG: T9SS type A sorting domain-containing protein, partial [Ignavibacteria bacterium]|nr:T9SS type A sorting domain-containing protein [Ignavibacteria bacterium]
AVLLKVADMPDKVNQFLAEDTGDGNSIKLSWQKNIESDVVGYNVSVGTDSSTYDTTFFAVDTTVVVSGLQEGIEYFFGVYAIDSDGNEGFTIEKSIIPNSFPLTPQNIVDHPQWHKVMFKWLSNKELDLIGYNLYRSESTNGNYAKINQAIISDTTFIDENMDLGKYYYYILKAVDSDLNESDPSAIIKSMAISLDRGILLVDETKNGSGNLFDPTDEQVDEFYNSILSDFYHNNFDVDISGEIKLSDIGSFSTIIWHGNDYSDFNSALNAVSIIKEYLDYGGNFLFTGFSASKSFNGNIGILNSFAPGDFIYDYLKIDTSINKLSTLFISASPKTPEYSFINVDSSKSSLATNYHIRKVEAISSNTEGAEIYKYNSNYDSTTSQGSMRGLPVGVEYIGNDYKTVILNIPLFYMNQDQAKVLIDYILEDKFNELTDVEDETKEIVPSNFVLYQNYPNPFNPSTKISWQSPVGSWQTLKVYDILGNEIATLLNEEKPAGNYEVEINASKFASGVYFYQLKAGYLIQTKKMILTK